MGRLLEIPFFQAVVVLSVLAHPAAFADDTESPIAVVNQQDQLPQAQPIETFIDTRGMSQRKFRQALKSWEGIDARLFDLSWGSVLRRDFPSWGNGQRVYRIDDQDLQRIRRGLMEAMCTTLPCRQNFNVPLSFSDDDTRRIRSCTVIVTVEDGTIDRIRIENDGCRYNAKERDASRYDPEKDPGASAVLADPSP